MPRCAFLTLSQVSNFVIDDEHAFGPLRALGWRVDAVPWDRPGMVWRGYDLVVIRSSWDYHKDPNAFLAVLGNIEDKGVPLENSLGTVRWNMRKTYLRELAERGVPTVPTVFRDRLGGGDLEGLFEVIANADLAGGEVVLKPVVGANADGAFRLDRRTVGERAAEVEAYYARRPLMAQPFARAVLDEGEYSLFYFNGVHSHTILKTPKAEDFRVQEEHGAQIRAVAASEALLDAGRAARDALSETPLYVRADFVRSNGGGESYWLMELELIEPSLYLRMDPGAPRRFARALDARFAARRN